MKEALRASGGNSSRNTKKEIFMDTYEFSTPTAPPVRAKKKHIVLFVIACVLLAGALFWAYALISMWLAPPQMDAPAEEYGPLGIMAMLMAGAAYGLALVISLLSFGLTWGGGQVISALLAMEKRDKPRGLWLASLVIAWIHAAVALCVIGVGIWA